MKTAVIGTGNMGKHHVRLLHKISSLVAISDVNEKKGTEFAEKYNCKYYKDYNEMLNKEEIDAISLAVPTNIHKKIALDIINKGINILIEKPIATTIEDAQEIIDAAENNNVKLMVSHVERFNPAVIKLKDLIDKNELGKINTIVARRVGVAGNPLTYEDVMLDLAVHDIDIFNYLIKKQPNNVFSLNGNSGINKKNDYADMLIDYGDTNAFLQVNWITPIKIRMLNVTGTKGYAELNYITQELKLYKMELIEDYDDYGEFVTRFGNPEERIFNIQKAEPLELELKSFLRCIEKNTTPEVTGEDALNAIKIILNASK